MSEPTWNLSEWNKEDRRTLAELCRMDGVPVGWLGAQLHGSERHHDAIERLMDEARAKAPTAPVALVRPVKKAGWRQAPDGTWHRQSIFERGCLLTLGLLAIFMLLIVGLAVISQGH